MNSQDFSVGFFGKIPSHGDFISRRLPRQFIEPWDQWLQGGISASREQLGQEWLNIFLVSPIWQFGLMPGLCGDEAWAGVMMPSVDKVGRYYPLTLASRIYPAQLPLLFDPSCVWFDALSQLAFTSLDYDFDLLNFDTSLERLLISRFLSDQVLADYVPVPQIRSSKLAFHFQLNNEQDTPQAFADLGEVLKNRFLANCSFWRSSSFDDTNSASLLFCEGLPPYDAYVGFLNGKWPQHGWQFSRHQVQKSSNQVPGQLEFTESQQVSSDIAFLDSGLDAGPGLAATTQSPEKLTYQSFGLSVVGLKRKLNEDAILQRNDVGLWMVADGMGGHSAGDVASQALVDALAKIPPSDDLEYFSEQVAASLHTVNRQLIQMAQTRGYGQIIGSTIVILLISGRQFRYLWAGDSRLYRFRQGELEQLSLDHSLYNESISQGLSPLDGSLEQGRGNIITRAVGADSRLQLDCGQGEIMDGDMFILSSDGLDKELTHADIAQFCNLESAEAITRNLIQEAEQRGGRDNISVIVVKASSRDELEL
jgi:type VI secretion system protein ImpM